MHIISVFVFMFNTAFIILCGHIHCHQILRGEDFRILECMLYSSLGQGHLVSGDSVVPLPYTLWGKGSQHWITLLYVALSLAWALEIVSHLEGIDYNLADLSM
jgi:hypothetical protein